jgi:hypothetical protein
MKSIYIGFLTLFLLFSCNNSESNTTSNNADLAGEQDGTPKIEFDKTSHDFGEVVQGEKVGWFFTFTNTGDAPLLIRRASATCGCTVPEYNKEPIPPGGEGKLKVVYDSSGRSGKDFKTVTVETNAENRITKLNLTVEILTK